MWMTIHFKHMRGNIYLPLIFVGSLLLITQIRYIINNSKLDYGLSQTSPF